MSKLMKAKPLFQPRPFRWRLTVATLVFVVACAAGFIQAAEVQLNVLALGDWGADTPAQKVVATAMASYVEHNHFKLDAVLLLGDNFYVPLPGGADDSQWKTLFEQMYDPKRLAAPFYAVLGNHDYQENRAQVELDYAKCNPQSRFKLPARRYRVNLPQDQPLVTLLALDSNSQNLDPQSWADQRRWLERELAKPRAAWTVCFAHHPLFSDSRHGDNDRLQTDWGPALKTYRVDFYLAGHEHCLEHLQIPGWTTSFVVSGGGGQSLYPIQRHDHAQFARSEYGFVHLQFKADTVRVTYIDKDGRTLYGFERNHQGKVKAFNEAASDAQNH